MNYEEQSALAKWYGCSTADIQKMIAYEDWSMWRRLEEKVMEDETLWHEFLKRLGAITGDITHHISSYMETDLPTRCRALTAALNSLPS